MAASQDKDNCHPLAGLWEQLEDRSKVSVAEKHTKTILRDFCLPKNLDTPFGKDLTFVLATSDWLGAKYIRELRQNGDIRKRFQLAKSKTIATGSLHYPDTITVAINYLVFVQLKLPFTNKESIGVLDAAGSTQALPLLILYYNQHPKIGEIIGLEVPKRLLELFGLCGLKGQPRNIRIMEEESGRREEQGVSTGRITMILGETALYSEGDRIAYDMAVRTGADDIEEGTARVIVRTFITRSQALEKVQPLLDLLSMRGRNVTQIKKLLAEIDDDMFLVLDAADKATIVKALKWFDLELMDKVDSSSLQDKVEVPIQRYGKMIEKCSSLGEVVATLEKLQQDDEVNVQGWSHEAAINESIIAVTEAMARERNRNKLETMEKMERTRALRNVTKKLEWMTDVFCSISAGGQLDDETRGKLESIEEDTEEMLRALKAMERKEQDKA